jgi:hypothetical protein
VGCLAKILYEAAKAEVFLLALHGLLIDQLAPAVFKQQVALLAAQFVKCG